MARWKLTESHYLLVPEHYWEQMETDRDTGKQKRKKYPVPTHLNPKDPSDWTHRTGLDVSRGGSVHADGDIVVSWAKGYTFERDDGVKFTCKVESDDKRDHIFVGSPTPGMDPVDDEAKAISAQFAWKDDPTKEVYFGMSYAERLVFDAITKEKNQDTVSLQKVMAEALAAIAATTAQTNALLSQMAQQRRL